MRSPQKSCQQLQRTLDLCYPALGVSQGLMFINPMTKEGNADANPQRIWLLSTGDHRGAGAASEPPRVHEELTAMRAQLVAANAQPSLF